MQTTGGKDEPNIELRGILSRTSFLYRNRDGHQQHGTQNVKTCLKCIHNYIMKKSEIYKH